MAIAVATPADARSLLDRVDYEDAHEAPLTTPRTASECVERAVGWAHRGVPAIQLLHRTLRLRVTRPDVAHPLGWSILRRTPERVVLGADGPLLTPRIYVEAVGGHVTIATVARFETRAAAPIWTGVAPLHRFVLRRLADASA